MIELYEIARGLIPNLRMDYFGNTCNIYVNNNIVFNTVGNETQEFVRVFLSGLIIGYCLKK